MNPCCPAVHLQKWPWLCCVSSALFATCRSKGDYKTWIINGLLNCRFSPNWYLQLSIWLNRASWRKATPRLPTPRLLGGSQRGECPRAGRYVEARLVRLQLQKGWQRTELFKAVFRHFPLCLATFRSHIQSNLAPRQTLIPRHPFDFALYTPSHPHLRFTGREHIRHFNSDVVHDGR